MEHLNLQPPGTGFRMVTTPVSNFDIGFPSSGESSGGSNSQRSDSDGGLSESVIPEGCGIGGWLRDSATNRLRGDRPYIGLPVSPSSSSSVFGDNGSIHESVLRRRRLLLEGRDESESGGEQRNVVLCAVWLSGKFAAAYYDLEMGQVCVLPDICDTPPSFTVLRNIFTQVFPTHIVISKNSSDEFQEVVYELSGHKVVAAGEPEGVQRESRRNTTQVHVLPSKDFEPGSCKVRLQSTKLPHSPKNATLEEHAQYISLLIPISNEVMVRAVGCLLKFLDKSSIELFQLELVGGQVPVIDLSMVKMDDYMLVDESAWQSLQIFATEFHPSSLKQGSNSGSKEGLSVYSLLNQCTTPMGAKKLRLMLLRPLRNFHKLRDRYDVIEYCLDTNHLEYVKSMKDSLRSIKSIPKFLYRLSVVQATANEWKGLYQSLYHCLLLGELCKSLQDVAPQLIQEIGNEEYLIVLRTLTQEMIHKVDFDASIAARRIVAREGLDANLDRKKKQYSCLPEIMSIIASEEVSDLPSYANQCCVVYIPEVGYLLAVTLWRENLSESDLVIAGLEYRFRSNELAYYKSARMKELDVILGDCAVAILEMETVIMLHVAEMLLEKGPCLLKFSDKVAELDCLIAMSCVSSTYSFVRPRLLPKGETIRIVRGKHPISDLIQPVVANTTSFQQGERMAIITGPNASGKSLYLKQIGMIVIMALSGSYIPAESAHIPLFDRLCTRINFAETVSSGVSAFMADVNQMSLALRYATRDSLIIVDEFGKGTSEADGLALLAASIQHFIDQNHDCPTMFLSTHFSSVVNYLSASPILKYQTMKFLQENGTITYLYELKDGFCERSFAQLIAQSVELPSSVIARAREIEAAATRSIQSVVNLSQMQREDTMIAMADDFLLTNFGEVDSIPYLAHLKSRCNELD